MLNREFTLREKILLLVFSVFLVGVFVYQVAFVSIDQEMDSYNLDTITDQITTEELKLNQINVMKHVIADSEGKVVGNLSIYNNLPNEIIAMSNIFNDNAENVSISWSDPVLSDTIVRRDVNITFTATSYANYKQLLKQLSECEYRTLIRDITITSGSDTSDMQTSTELNGTVSLTFYETIDGASTTSGLVVSES